MSQNLKIIGKCLFVIIFTCIAIGSLSPSDSVPKMGSYDKVIHLISYFCLSVCFWFGFVMNKNKWIMVALLIVYGGLIEFLQSFVPGRMMSIGDFVANSLGVLIGFYFYQLCFKIKNKLGEGV